MQHDGKMMERVVAVTGEVIDILLPQLSGDDPMPWDSVVLAATMAIKAFAAMAGQLLPLSETEIREKMLAAITQGMNAKVNAMACKSKDEFDEVCAAQDAALHSPVH